jgi:uncharacterized membrane protein
MAVKKTKREIVKLLLNQEFTAEDDEELIDLLVEQPIAIDVDKQEDKTMTRGDRVADRLSEIAGSWGFIFGFTLFLLLWIVLNLTGIIKLDAFPFILLNLLLSCLAALQAPIIMMSQNRQAKKDSLRNQNDYRTDLKSELITEEMHHKLEEILKNERKILRLLEDDVDEKK